MRGRSFFILKGGGIGTAANEVRKGDKVVALFGCAFPIVLRKRTGIASDHGSVFAGEAYVDGMMEGEALVGKETSDFEDFEIW